MASDPRQMHENVAEAKRDPTFWQSMSPKEAADGLDLHPLVVGLMFELPTADSGRPAWTQQRRAEWLALAAQVVDVTIDREQLAIEAAPVVRELPPPSPDVPELRERYSAAIDHAAELRAQLAEVTAERDKLTAGVQEAGGKLREQLDDASNAVTRLVFEKTDRTADSRTGPPTPGKVTSEQRDKLLKPHPQPEAEPARGRGRPPGRTEKTHCINGHELTPDNTYTKPSGQRVCKTCKEAAALRYRNSQVAADQARRPITTPAATPPPPGTLPCKVDGCSGTGPTHGRQQKLCDDHYDTLARGGALPIDGVDHQYVGTGNTRKLVATHELCRGCGAHLAKENRTFPFRCTPCQGRATA